MADSFVVLDGEVLDGAVAELWHDDGIVYAQIRIPGKAPDAVSDGD